MASASSQAANAASSARKKAGSLAQEGSSPLHASQSERSCSHRRTLLHEFTKHGDSRDATPAHRRGLRAPLHHERGREQRGGQHGEPLGVYSGGRKNQPGVTGAHRRCGWSALWVVSPRRRPAELSPPHGDLIVNCSLCSARYARPAWHIYRARMAFALLTCCVASALVPPSRVTTTAAIEAASSASSSSASFSAALLSWCIQLRGNSSCVRLSSPPREGRRGRGFLEDLPPKAKQAYLQYLPQLQLDGDFFAFELTPLLSQPGRWDKIFALTESTNIGSAQSVSRLDREFITPMRILTLSFPPDMGGEEMQASIDQFQKSMFKLSALARKNAMTGNVAAPTAASEVKQVEEAFDGGRLALNKFFEAVTLAPAPNGCCPSRRRHRCSRRRGYPRSERLYTQLLKDAALCRNRGGEQLAGLWGQLMVYGTIPGVNPCGDAAAKYYTQGL